MEYNIPALVIDFLRVHLLQLRSILSLELPDLFQEVPRAQLLGMISHCRDIFDQLALSSVPAEREHTGLVRPRVDSSNKHHFDLDEHSSHLPAVG